MHRILPLSPDAVAQVISSNQLRSLKDVVLGLVGNCLDAGADKIEIAVQFAQGSCSVEDNGCGILPQDFGDEGGLARRNHTSQLPEKLARTRHAHSGTFLASLSALSYLKITSRHVNHPVVGTLTMHVGKTIGRHIVQAPSPDLSLSPAHGTRVDVHNLFGHIPVRVKQRIGLHEEHDALQRQWRELEHGLVALLIAWPAPCNLILRSPTRADGQKRFALNASSSLTLLTHRNLRDLSKPPNLPDLRCFIPYLIQADLAPANSRFDWIPISAKSSSLSLKGLICLHPAPTRRCQFVSYGIHPCNIHHGFHELYDRVNDICSKSSFGSPKYLDGMKESNASVEVESSLKIRGSGSRKRSGKGSSRWPMFVFKFEGSGGDMQWQFGFSTVQLEKCVSLVSAAVDEWLKSNHFLLPSHDRTKHLETAHYGSEENSLRELTAPHRTTYTTSLPGHVLRNGSDIPLDGGYNVHSHIRSSKRFISDLNTRTPNTMYEEDPKHLANSPNMADCFIVTSLQSRDESECLDDADLLALETPTFHSGRFDPLPVPQGAIEDFGMQWVDSMTGEIHEISNRTGLILSPAQQIQTVKTPPISRRDTWLGKTKVLTLAQRRQRVPKVTNDDMWLPKFISQWRNPIFARQPEKAIPSTEMTRFNQQNGSSNCCYATGLHNLSHSVPSDVRFSKSQLSQIQVIGQVDFKFILCCTPGRDDGGKPTLLMIDQHAASERVILERLLVELVLPPSEPEQLIQSACGHSPSVRSNALETPLVFRISPSEIKLFGRSAARFASWGIIYDLGTDRIVVKALPPGICERCVLFPDLLIELLRNDCWQSYDDINFHGVRDLSGQCLTDEKNSWPQRVGSCPNGIIDMLNSRACRSAIMFNDPLSLEESRQLLDDLAQCVFPFICAHGRTSVVPLVGLDSQDGRTVTQSVNASRKDTWFHAHTAQDQDFQSKAGAWLKDRHSSIG